MYINVLILFFAASNLPCVFSPKMQIISISAMSLHFPTFHPLFALPLFSYIVLQISTQMITQNVPFGLIIISFRFMLEVSFDLLLPLFAIWRLLHYQQLLVHVDDMIRGHCSVMLSAAFAQGTLSTRERVLSKFKMGGRMQVKHDPEACKYAY